MVKFRQKPFLQAGGVPAHALSYALWCVVNNVRISWIKIYKLSQGCRTGGTEWTATPTVLCLGGGIARVHQIFDALTVLILTKKYDNYRTWQNASFTQFAPAAFYALFAQFATPSLPGNLRHPCLQQLTGLLAFLSRLLSCVRWRNTCQQGGFLNLFLAIMFVPLSFILLHISIIVIGIFRYLDNSR